MILQVLAGAVGAVAFALLFGIPRRYFVGCSLTAAVGWLVYSLLEGYTGAGVTLATLAASVCMALAARAFAVRQSCPVTVFLTSGITPLVPGGRLFWMAYYMVIGSNAPAAENGLTALKAAFAIVLGIVIVFEIPGSFFGLFRPRPRPRPASHKNQ